MPVEIIDVDALDGDQPLTMEHAEIKPNLRTIAKKARKVNTKTRKAQRQAVLENVVHAAREAGEKQDSTHLQFQLHAAMSGLSLGRERKIESKGPSDGTVPWMQGSLL